MMEKVCNIGFGVYIEHRVLTGMSEKQVEELATSKLATCTILDGEDGIIVYIESTLSEVTSVVTLSEIEEKNEKIGDEEMQEMRALGKLMGEDPQWLMWVSFC
jgi:uncharacterized protein YwgA